MNCSVHNSRLDSTGRIRLPADRKRSVQPVWTWERANRTLALSTASTGSMSLRREGARPDRLAVRRCLPDRRNAGYREDRTLTCGLRTCGPADRESRAIRDATEPPARHQVVPRRTRRKHRTHRISAAPRSAPDATARRTPLSNRALWAARKGHLANPGLQHGVEPFKQLGVRGAARGRDRRLRQRGPRPEAGEELCGGSWPPRRVRRRDVGRHVLRRPRAPAVVDGPPASTSP